MTLTGMKKHVGVSEQAGPHDGEGWAGTNLQARPVPTRGRDGMDRLTPPARDARFDELDKVVEELKQKEKGDERKEEKVNPQP